MSETPDVDAARVADPHDTTRFQMPPTSPGDLLDQAWVLIANVSGGDWSQQHPDWQARAAEFRDQYTARPTPAVAAHNPDPYIGADVHYVAYGTPAGEYPSTCRAAKITEAGARQPASLVVFNPSGMFFNSVPYSADRAPGTWHWPHP